METQTYLNFCTTCFWVFTASEILTDASGSWREGSVPGFRCMLAIHVRHHNYKRRDPLPSSE